MCGAWRQLFWEGETSDLTKVKPNHWLEGGFVHLKTLGWSLGDDLRFVEEIRQQFSIFFFFSFFFKYILY